MKDNNNNDSKKPSTPATTPVKIGRRGTLKLFSVGAATSLLGFAVLACKKDTPQGGSSGDTKAGGNQGCDTEIDDTSRNLRKTLQYKKEASDPAKQCKACAQFEAAKFGDCGGCKLFTGPVRPNGGCLSFAPKEGGAAAPN